MSKMILPFRQLKEEEVIKLRESLQQQREKAKKHEEYLQIEATKKVLR